MTYFLIVIVPVEGISSKTHGMNLSAVLSSVERIVTANTIPSTLRFKVWHNQLLIKDKIGVAFLTDIYYKKVYCPEKNNIFELFPYTWQNVPCVFSMRRINAWKMHGFCLIKMR